MTNIYIVQYDWSLYSVELTIESAKAAALEAHKLDGYKHSVWVTQFAVGCPGSDVEIGMYRRNPDGPRKESAWIPYQEDWESDDDCQWVPINP